jgi:peptidoglycan hydrolase-like protein with peptidoglycan-binding domain
MSEQPAAGRVSGTLLRQAVGLLTLAACAAIVVNAVFLQEDGAKPTAGDGVELAGRDKASAPGDEPVTRITVTPQGEDVADGDLVRQVQEELGRLGLYGGAADGVAGARTRAAVSAYQRANGLAVTGEPSPEVLDHMRYMKQLAEAASFTSSLDEPKASEDVRRVQKALIALGFDAGGADGILTERTREAIRAFEAYRGLPVTGTVTPDLARALGIVLQVDG